MPAVKFESLGIKQRITEALNAFSDPAFICYQGQLWLNQPLASLLETDGIQSIGAVVPRNLHHLLDNPHSETFELQLLARKQPLYTRTMLSPYHLADKNMTLGLVVGMHNEIQPRHDTQKLHCISIQTRDDNPIEKEKAAITLQSISEGIISLDANGYIEYMNTMAELLTGVNLEDALDRKLDEVLFLIDEINSEPVIPLISLFESDASQSETPRHLRIKHVASGFTSAVEISTSPIVTNSGQSIGNVLVIHDISDLRHLSQQLMYQASHDSLTGLINRAEFEKRLKLLLDDACQNKNKHVMCYIDLDQFKTVNDTCGHLAGDELLRQISAQLMTHTKSRDTLGRLGGDEFGLLLTNCTIDHAREVTERIRKTVMSHRFHYDDKIFHIGASIGVVIIDQHAGTLDDVLSTVDSACYLAKEAGRNRVHFVVQDDEVIHRRKTELHWVQQIQHALAEDRFELYTQPIIALDPSLEESHHQEILLRMISTNGEVIEPKSFITAAQRYNMMAAIDRWVIYQAFRRFSDSEDPVNDEAYSYTSINISGQSINDDEFVDFLLGQIEQYRIDTTRLCFEVAESAVIANLNRATQFMEALKPSGCRFALDNFCSSLSSFSYIKNLPIDYLKIDGHFMQNLIDDEIDSTVVSAIRDVTSLLGVNTIAETVEDKYTFNALKTLGIDYAQGYFISPPKNLLEQHEQRSPPTLNIH